MYTLASDEKATSIFTYTYDGLFRGEVVTKQSVRISTWLRTDAAPDYIHLYNVQAIEITGGPIKPVAFAEMFLPTTTVIGMHMAPPARDPVDYDEREGNRVLLPIVFLMGRFSINGKIRISTATDLATSLTISRQKWMSIYEADVHSPHLPQMPSIQVPMLLVRPMEVSFCLPTTA